MIKINTLQRFFQLESTSGIILFLMAVLAMIWANSPLASLHHQFIETFLFWINDGLMTLFFLLVGLELKRGFVDGNLSSFSQIILPAGAALGGMIIPALVYVYFNYTDPVTLKGWATPVATDVAFALGVLSLFGRFVPPALKLFLLALAIFDDIGAIIIITFFYAHGLSFSLVGLSIALTCILFLFNFFSVRNLIPYLGVGLGLWMSLLYSGVHPTIAGVLLAMSLPDGVETAPSPLHQVEDFLHPIVAYFIMPLFALANAGVPLHGVSFHTLTSEVVLGISLGLFIGKQIGVFSFSWLLIRLKIAQALEDTSWLALYGVAILCGIGFTMSLFLGTLSFESDKLYLSHVRIGVIIGSLLSGLAGASILLIAFGRVRSKIG